MAALRRFTIPRRHSAGMPPASPARWLPVPCRATAGRHHHVSGRYLAFYAREMAWREDNRRQPNGSLHEMATAAALAHPVSRVWAGYWQRSR